MSRFFTKYNRDYYGGALIALLGLYAVLQGRTYGIGTVRNMGPGFFPVAIGVIMTVLGIAIALVAERPAQEEKDKADKAAKSSFDWRGPFWIIVGNISFVIFGTYGGLLPATFATVFLCSFGDRKNTFKSAFCLAAAMTVFSAVVFYWALQVQMPLFGWGA